jgi:hypothetical protein
MFLKKKMGDSLDEKELGRWFSAVYGQNPGARANFLKQT